MADLVIDIEYKKRFLRKEFLSLPELMLRWPFQCFLKIPFEVFKNKLKLYFLLENATSIKVEHTIQACKAIKGHFSLQFIIKNFGSFIFKINNVESIERVKKHYTDIPEKQLIIRSFDMCTPQNINKLAAPFSYILSKYGNNYYFNEFNTYDVEHDFFAESFDTSFSYKFDKLELPNHIDDSILWNECKFSIPKRKRDEEELDYYRKELERYRMSGEKNPYRLAKKIQTFSGNSLVNGDIGKLLPAHPGTKIEDASFERRGQRLLNTVK